MHINSSNQGLKFQTGILAGQMLINSLNPSLNFKPRFENLKPRFKTLNLRLKEKVHIHSSNQGLKFQTGVLAGQMHINSLNLRFNFKLGLKILNLGLKEKVHINSSNQGMKFQTGFSQLNAH